MALRPLGLRRDTPDERDLRYRKDYLKMSRIGQLIRAFVLPDRVDLREEANAPVIDQGAIGSCAACSLVACMSHVASDQGGGVPIYSRLFAYGNARGWSEEDSGSTLREVIKGVDHNGICLEAMWPYDISRWQEKPPQEVWDAAHFRHEIEYYRLLTVESMKMALAYERKPFLFGIAIYDSFDCTAPEYLVPMPKPGDKLEGGHAMVVMGYDDTLSAWLVRNSWGPTWGLGGYCWIPYAYLHPPSPLVYELGANLFYDAWAVRKVTV